MSSETFELDILGQQPGMHKLYTQVSFIYHMPDSTVRDSIVGILEKGLDKLTRVLPWLGGQVCQEDVNEGNTGTFRIRFNRVTKVPFVVKDLVGDPSAPTIETLKNSKFPMSMLKEKVIAPCLTLNLPENASGISTDSTPALAIQANFIKGGLILTIVAEHNVMDMTGQGAVIDWLSKACYGYSLEEEVSRVGNMDRTQAVSFKSNDELTGDELDNQLINSSKIKNEGNETQPHCSWAYFTISEESLKILKDEATATLPLTTKFVSSDDTLCAFIWRCISRVRLQRLQSNTKSVFARAVDVRETMELPSNYTGLMQTMTYHNFSLDQLKNQPLGQTAAEFRRQLDPNIRNNVKQRFLALTSYIIKNRDRSRISLTASVDASSGIALSSWAKSIGYDVDFNLGLGNPVSVRRPMFTPVESLLYIMPKDLQGEISIAACFSDEDWMRLREDEEFIKYTSYIG